MFKDAEESFFNNKTTLTQFLETAIEYACHSGATIMGQSCFGTAMPSQMLAPLVTFYEEPIINELEHALLCLHEPMDRIQLVKVMLYGIEEYQLLLLSNPNKQHKPTDTLKTSYQLRAPQTNENMVVCKGIGKVTWPPQSKQDLFEHFLPILCSRIQSNVLQDRWLFH